MPARTAAALARVDVLRRCGDGPGALTIYATLLRREPRTRWGYEAAALAIAEGLADRAREIFKKDGAPARVGLALLHVAAFETTVEPAEAEAARTHYQAALALAPDDPYALGVALRHYLALAYREPERLALAVQLCQERTPGPSAQPDPTRDVRGDALLLATCAGVSIAADDPGEARRRFALALTLWPADVAARLAWAAAELAAGNDRSAAELYAPALDAPAASDRYLAGLGLGVARTRLHDHTGAESAYRTAAAARGWKSGDPPQQLAPELQFNLGTLLAAATDPRRRAEARELLRAYVERRDADELRRLRARQLLLDLRE